MSYIIIEKPLERRILLILNNIIYINRSAVVSNIILLIYNLYNITAGPGSAANSRGPAHPVYRGV